MGDGCMPATKIIPFQYACGINLVTQYQAASCGLLTIPIPTGRKATHKDINELSKVMTETASLLYQHNEGKKSPEEVVAALNNLMEDLAYQRGNIEKEYQPELDL
jgi:CRISPR/Cas system CSM-associated protein Csm2 small subunit